MNGDKLTLRPEDTAGIVRSAIEHNITYDGPKRIWYNGPMFRHENRNVVVIASFTKWVRKPWFRRPRYRCRINRIASVSGTIWDSKIFA